MLLTHAEPIAVWLDGNDRPTRLVYRSARWTVLDAPTPLDVDWPGNITHPPAGAPAGWRFTARNSTTGEALVFDVRLIAGGAWVVEQVYA